MTNPSTDTEATQAVISVGARFGRLVVTGEHSRTRRGIRLACRCDCGADHNALSTELRRGRVKSCGCLWRDEIVRSKSLPPQEGGFRRMLRKYQAGAARRGLEWGLADDQVRGLVVQACHYCAAPPTCVSTSQSCSEKARIRSRFAHNGLDRVDSSRGYVPGNVVPCCATCNYAKAETPYEDFVAWVRRVCANLEAR